MSSKKASTRRVHIVGFAPSWQETPWDDTGSEIWGMNALHKVAAGRPFHRWYQLHDIDTHHPNDRDEHIAWLSKFDGPVYMWAEHVEKYGDEIPNAVAYPREDVIAELGSDYFTNTVSWMIAHAIWERRSKISVYGVDMAQEPEYAAQRPSCEYWLGLAAGKGITVHIPETSDLLKTPVLYGVEDHTPARKRMEQRLGELKQKRQSIANDMAQLQQAAAQLDGAIENQTYILRAWSIPANEPEGELSNG